MPYFITKGLEFMKANRITSATLAAVMTLGMMSNFTVSAESLTAQETQKTSFTEVDGKKEYDEAEWEAFKRAYWDWDTEDTEGEYNESENRLKIRDDGLIYDSSEVVGYIGRSENLVIPKKIDGNRIFRIKYGLNNLKTIKILTIEAEIEDLVKPLYFSTKESSLEINIFGDNEDNEGYRFHFLDGKVTMTRAVKEGFEISEVTFEEIRELISGILPAGYNADSVKVDISLDISKVSRIFVVKNTVMSVKSFVTTLVESDGIVYEEDTEDNISSVSGSDFADKLYKILTEV